MNPIEPHVLLLLLGLQTTMIGIDSDSKVMKLVGAFFIFIGWILNIVACMTGAK